MAAPTGPLKAVAWSPHHQDQFLVASNGLRLFETNPSVPSFSEDIDQAQASTTQRDSNASSSLTTAQTSRSDHQKPLSLVSANLHHSLTQSTVVDWYPSNKHGNIVAVGHRTGTVTITGVDAATELGAGLSNRRDCSPRMNRHCSQVAWNPHRPNILAVGLDRLTRESSLLLWDVSSKAVSLGDTKRWLPGTGVSNETAFSYGTANRAYSRAYASSGPARTAGPTEMAVGEGVLSLAWLPNSQDILLAGIGTKSLKRFDFRESAREGAQHSFSNCRGAHCLTVDPNFPDTFASYSRADYAIKIWDMRQFEDPVHIIPTTKHQLILNLSWCPTRGGMLGALVEHERCVRLYDTHILNSVDLNDFATGSANQISTRKTRQSQLKSLVHFDWHPTIRNKIMTINQGGTIGVNIVQEMAVCDVSPRGELLWGASRSTLRTINVNATITNNTSSTPTPTSNNNNDDDDDDNDNTFFANNTNTNNNSNITANDNTATIITNNNNNNNNINTMLVSTLDTTLTPDQVQALFLDGTKIQRSLQSSATTDISILMKRRALAGCGMDIGINLAEYEDPAMCKVWSWLDNVLSPAWWLLGEVQAADDVDPNITLIGVRDALAYDSESFLGVSVGYNVPLGSLDVHTYESVLPRVLSVRLCGWAGLHDDEALDAKLDRLEKNGEFQRAAAIAVFHQNIPRAIRSLTVGANVDGDHRESMLSAAIALAGYHPARNAHGSLSDSMWRDTTRMLLAQLPSTYLRCTFEFLLTCDSGENFSSILDETTLELSDRVAFACRYLADEDLSVFLDVISKASVVGGLLGGLLIEGFSETGLSIISSYVDKTADVQTASILTAKAALFSQEQKGLRSQRSQSKLKTLASAWLDAYRDLLDQWQLWAQRAKFDVARSSPRSNTIAAQVFFRCAFCNKSVIQSGMSRATMSRGLARPVTSCTCGKPLPRCSICLMHLGTGSNRTKKSKGFGYGYSHGKSVHNTSGNSAIASKVTTTSSTSTTTTTTTPTTPTKPTTSMPTTTSTTTPTTSTTTMSSSHTSPMEMGRKTQPFGSWFSWCQSCQHGGHADHISSWFHDHDVCPVSGCRCKCMETSPHILA